MLPVAQGKWYVWTKAEACQKVSTQKTMSKLLKLLGIHWQAYWLKMSNFSNDDNIGGLMSLTIDEDSILSN